ncbi:MAG: amidase [Myxococcales bacterium]|nr:amidase [Myxococcales bacterium]
MDDLLQRPLTELLDRLARKDVSAVDVMERTLARIGSLNPQLNAFCELGDEAGLYDQARAAEQRWHDGTARPLEGIPLGVKELEDAEGFHATHGSVPFKDRVAEQDSPQVARLRAAGAIVVGKTNAPEFGYTAITKNLLHGVTRSPWNLEHTPGGSSGGSSAAIAGGMVPLATASDGGGSIRLPATFTGCFGLKISYGRIPNGPLEAWGTSHTAVVGPLTRTVEDAALHLDLVAGPHPCDAHSLPHPGISYRETLRELPAGLRIAYSPDLGFGAVQSDVAEVVAEAAQVFQELGHDVQEIKGGPPELGRQWGLINAFEAAGKLAPLIETHEQQFGRSFLQGTKAGFKMTPEIWWAAQQQRQALCDWCETIFDQYDLLLTPTTISDPPPAKGPLPTEIEGKPAPWGSSGAFTIPFNLSWHPAGTVRAGFSKAKLPVGLQIVAPRHRDDRVLQAAWAFEQARPWAEEWPEL